MTSSAGPRARRTYVTSPQRMKQYQDERDRIIRAAFGLIGRNGGQPVPVLDVLEAAGLSTRAFYRHFRSKDDLILTMYRTAADRLGSELSAAIATADGPAEALEAWIRHYLAVAFDPRRTRQASVLNSPEVRAVPGYDQVRQQHVAVHRTMLAEVLRSGRRAGVFPNATDPDEDARAVLSVVAGLLEASLAGAATPDWAGATQHTTALFLRAFGAVHTSGDV